MWVYEVLHLLLTTPGSLVFTIAISKRGLRVQAGDPIRLLFLLQFSAGTLTGIEYSDAKILVCTDSNTILVISRKVTRDVLGRNTLSKESNVRRIGCVHSLYPNRGMEWVCIRHICEEALNRQGQEDLIPHLEYITFGWKYYGQFRSLAYKPADVFRDFSFNDMTFMSPCPCNSHKRFAKFMDPTTAEKTFDLRIPSLTDSHIRTMDTEIVRDNTLKNNLRMDSTIYLFDRRYSTKSSKQSLMHGCKYASY